MEQDKLFDTENRIYKYYLNSIEKDKTSIEFIKDLFKLELMNTDKSEDMDLIQIYNIVGFDKFFELIAYCGNKPIKLPKVDKVKKLLTTAIAYYQVNVLGLKPKEAGKILTEKLGTCNLKQKSIKSIIGKLQRELEELSEKVVKTGGKNGRNFNVER